MRYIPNSPADRTEMLEAIGLSSVEDLFVGIPAELRLDVPLKLPDALTEPELMRFFETASARNQYGVRSFLGAGIYRHYIPAVTDALVSRSEFYTAYTPYQAEIAQGTLQAIFEFQTYITQLTAMDVANASLYDGSTALAEAVFMANRITKRRRFLIAGSVHPEYRRVIETYMRRFDVDVETVGFTANGQLDENQLDSAIGPDVGGVVLQSPNFFGTIEKTERLAALAHEHGALAIVNVAEAMSLGLLRPPGQANSDEGRADIVVGEAQSLGIPMSFGGPHLGFIATRDRFMRQIPGRLVGMGHDEDGKRGFVLTLAAREQHIRREKATSNICTNQSLCALMTTIFLATVGPVGLREIAIQNVQKTAYLVDRIQEDTPHEVLFPGPRFNEFVVRLKGQGPERIQQLIRSGIVPGVELDRFFPELGSCWLVCATEVPRREDLDALVEGLA